MTTRSPHDDPAVLAHDRITVGEDSPPRQWMVVAHGILGTRANWRGIGRRFIKERPTWGVVTVDLPGHGESLAWAEGERERRRTIASCGDALASLCERLANEAPVAAVLGHSFGGKVATATVATLAGSDRHGAPPGALWIVDSPPEPRDMTDDAGITTEVFAALRRLPPRFVDRASFVSALTADGLSPPVASWLAMNLIRTDEGLHFGPNLDHLDDLMADFGRWDGWPVVRRVSEHTRCRVVIGERSTAYGPAARARLRREAARGVVEVSEVAGAGHWLHAEAPAEFVALLLAAHA